MDALSHFFLTSRVSSIERQIRLKRAFLCLLLMWIGANCVDLPIHEGQGTAWGEEIRVDSVYLSALQMADVPARETGVLEEILVRVGDRVEQGQPLVHLDRQEAELNASLSRTSLEMARQEYENELRVLYTLKASEVAQAELERSEEANRKYRETVSKTEVERLKLIAQKAVLDHELAEHERSLLKLTVQTKQLEHDLAMAQLQRRSIQAPIAGMVVKLDQHLGEWVQPGMPVLKIINTATLRAEAVVSGRYRQFPLQDCRVSVSVTNFSPSQTVSEKQGQVTGKITFVNPEIDPVDGTFRVWAELDNQDQLLRPGESVKMTIHLPE